MAQPTGNFVQFNLIGTDRGGAEALGNWADGVSVAHASGNLFWGNVIAFNGLRGICIEGIDAIGNRLQGNSIHSNAGLGIDLGGDWADAQ